MRTSTKLLGVVAIGGVLAASSAAFTAGGITAPTSAFVGGSVSQSITGAALESVVYNTDEAANTITSVALTFTDAAANGKIPGIAFNGPGVLGVYVCTMVTTGTSTCTGGPPAANTATSLMITVA